MGINEGFYSLIPDEEPARKRPVNPGSHAILWTQRFPGGTKYPQIAHTTPSLGVLDPKPQPSRQVVIRPKKDGISQNGWVLQL